MMEDCQHGFRVNKSVASAVREVFEKQKRYACKLEFDLTACFNKIELKAVDSVLYDVGVPKELVNYIR